MPFRSSVESALRHLAPRIPQHEFAAVVDHAMDSPGLRAVRLLNCGNQGYNTKVLYRFGVVMLPDFEKLNANFAKAVVRAIHRLARQDGVLSQIKTHTIHEGSNSAIRRADTSIDETEFIAAEASVTMSFEDIENIDLPMILNRLRSMASQFQEQQTKHFFQTLDEVTKRTGQVHSAKGRPLTNEDIFAIIEKMHLDFDRDKEVGDASIVAAPSMIPVFQRLSAEMDKSPELQRRWKKILEKKKDEYRAREADRNLDG